MTKAQKIKELDKRLKESKAKYYEILADIKKDDELKPHFIDFEILAFKERLAVQNFKTISKDISRLQGLTYGLFKSLISELESVRDDEIISQATKQNSRIYALFTRTQKELDLLIYTFFIDAYTDALNKVERGEK